MNIILACDSEYGIGINNDLPSWNLKEDMIRFKKLTIGNGNNVVSCALHMQCTAPFQFARPLCPPLTPKTWQ